MFGIEAVPCEAEQRNKTLKKLPVLYEYSRPKFIRLTAEETDKGHDHLNREILSPSDATTTDHLPWNVGYAEVINAGKSDFNEDQAWIFSGVMISDSALAQEQQPTISMTGKSMVRSDDSITVVMFGVCDGHAGWGAAIYAANTLQVRILEKLEAIKHFLFKYKSDGNEYVYASCSCSSTVRDSVQSSITIDNLIMGALEEAFVQLDAEIKRSQSTYYISGGCTSIVVLFLLGRIFTANAGDCRAILLQRNKNGEFDFTLLSNDHTPHSDRQRMQSIAYLQPELLGLYFGRYEMQRRARRKDLEKKEGCHAKLLFRDAYMRGWAMKEVNQEDVNKIPMVIGKAKRARLLSTIGTTRGLGDHDLTCQSGMYIKPFMSSAPDVSIYKLTSINISKDDVIVLASDGLWESLENSDAVENMTRNFVDPNYDNNCLYRDAAIEIVRQARGENTQHSWRTPNGEYASMDDITCFIIPIHLFSTPPTILSSVSNTVNKGVNPSDFLDVNIPALSSKLSDDTSACNFMEDGVLVQLDTDKFEDPGIQTII